MQRIIKRIYKTMFYGIQSANLKIRKKKEETGLNAILIIWRLQSEKSTFKRLRKRSSQKRY